ncbi:MAG: hypothetical protein WCQ47_01860 [bacterium]
MRSLLLALILFFTLINADLYALMDYSDSGVFSSTKAINEMVKSDASFLYRIDMESALKAIVGEMSFAKKVWEHYSVSLEVQSSLRKTYGYHSFETSVSRGFTDNKIYGLLSLGYRFGYFDRKEQWLVISTGTGFIPKPWGIESSLAYYQALTNGRTSRLRTEIFALYRFGGTNSYLDFGLQTSIYLVPSGELGFPDSTGYTQSDPLIEEFLQIEGGLIFRYTLAEKLVFTALFTNVVFINQTNYQTYDVKTDTYSKGYGTELDYAPKVFLGLAVKL